MAHPWLWPEESRPAVFLFSDARGPIHPHLRVSARLVPWLQNSDGGDGDVLVSRYQSHIAWVAGHDSDLVVGGRLDDGTYV